MSLKIQEDLNKGVIIEEGCKKKKTKETDKNTSEKKKCKSK